MLRKVNANDLRHAQFYLSRLRSIGRSLVAGNTTFAKIHDEWQSCMHQIRKAQKWAGANRESNDESAKLCIAFAKWAAYLIQYFPSALVRNYCIAAIWASRRLKNTADECSVIEGLGLSWRVERSHRRELACYIFSAALRPRKDPYLSMNVATAYYELGDLSRASSHLLVAESEDQEDTDWHMARKCVSLRAKIATRLGEYSQAKSLCEYSLRLAQFHHCTACSTAAWYDLSVAHGRLGELTEAINSLCQSWKLILLGGHLAAAVQQMWCLRNVLTPQNTTDRLAEHELALELLLSSEQDLLGAIDPLGHTSNGLLKLEVSGEKDEVLPKFYCLVGFFQIMLGRQDEASATRDKVLRLGMPKDKFHVLASGWFRQFYSVPD